MLSDTIYGVFADAMNENAVAGLHELRQRPAGQGFNVLAPDLQTVCDLVEIRPEVAKNLAEVWPGKTTVILSAKTLKQRWLAHGDDTIAFRVPNDPEILEILRATGPLAAPSANLHGELPARNIAEAAKYFDDKVAVYVDSGECPINAPSRMIRFAKNGDIEILRDFQSYQDQIAAAQNAGAKSEDFIISRKRKKFKFARFNEFDTCFHAEEWLAGRDNWLRNDAELVVEIGAGSALFLLEQAKLAPEKQFVAVDIKGDRLYQAARDAEKLSVRNIAFVRSDVAKITDLIPANSVSEIWVTFSDPYPRKSDAKHRLTAPRFLNYYRDILQPNGTLHFKTDNHGLFDWSLEQFVAENWRFSQLTYDLHESDLPESYKIMTSYEARFHAEGLPIMYAQLMLK